MGNLLCNIQGEGEDLIPHTFDQDARLGKWTQHENDSSHESDEDYFQDSLQIDKKRKKRLTLMQGGPKTDYSDQEDSHNNDGGDHQKRVNDDENDPQNGAKYQKTQKQLLQKEEQKQKYQKRQAMQMQLKIGAEDDVSSDEDDDLDKKRNKIFNKSAKNQDMTTREIFRQRMLLQLLKKQHNQLRQMVNIDADADNEEALQQETQEIDPFILRALQEEFKQQEENEVNEAASSLHKQPVSARKRTSAFTVSLHNMMNNLDNESNSNSKFRDNQLIDFDEMSILVLQQKLSRDVAVTGMDNLDLSEFPCSVVSMERTGDEELQELDQILKGCNLETLSILIDKKAKEISRLERGVVNNDTSMADEDYPALSQYELQPDELDLVNNEVDNQNDEDDDDNNLPAYDDQNGRNADKNNQSNISQRQEVVADNSINNDKSQKNTGARGRKKMSKKASKKRKSSQDPHETTNNQKENQELRQHISQISHQNKKTQFLFQLKKNHQGYDESEATMAQIANLKNARYRVESF